MFFVIRGVVIEIFIESSSKACRLLGGYKFGLDAVKLAAKLMNHCWNDGVGRRRWVCLFFIESQWKSTFGISKLGRFKKFKRRCFATMKSGTSMMVFERCLEQFFVWQSSEKCVFFVFVFKNLKVDTIHTSSCGSATDMAQWKWNGIIATLRIENSNSRPYTWTVCGWAGTQKYAVIWRLIWISKIGRGTSKNM